MRLDLIGHDHRYAVEQTALMLLGRRDTSEDWGEISLSPDGKAAHARFSVGGVLCEGQIAHSELGLDTPEDLRAVEQRLVKLAAYRALSQIVGTPPWGALSGVRPAKLVTKWLRRGASAEECLDLLQSLYCLREDKARLALSCAQVSGEIESDLAPGDVSVYIGIPFCPSRCSYCSFISADVKGSLALVEPYVDALAREIQWAGGFLAKKGLRVRSVYMGGGTPTALSAEQLDTLLTQLDRWLPRESLRELTVEAGRPDTITPEKLTVLRAHGVDRVSVNPQTLSDKVLQAIGRRHTAREFREGYALARKAGFEAVNTDLIAGLPEDSVEGFRATLEEIIALSPEEVTLHTLAMKRSAALQTSPQAVPDGKEVEKMLSLAQKALTAAGYRPYYLYRQKFMSGGLENVGWTRRETGSFYNVVMMEELHSVLALGAGGVTKLVDRQTGAITRHTNPKYPKEYLERTEDTITQREALDWPEN